MAYQENKQCTDINEIEKMKFRLVQCGLGNNVQTVEVNNEDFMPTITTLPVGPPPVLKSLESQIAEYLNTPERLPIHKVERAQKFWEREKNVESLFNVEACPLQYKLQVERNQTTGELLEFKEVPLENTGFTAQNSLSMLRQPGAPVDAVRGHSSNKPFWPGGLDEPSIDAITESIQVNFDDDDLLTVPPGFENGMCFKDATDNGTTPLEAVLKLTDLMTLDDEFDLGDEEDEEDEKTSEQNNTPTEDDGKDAELLEDVLQRADEISRPTETVKAEPAKKEWAIKVDVTAPVGDFYKKIPNMAYQWPFELDVFQKQAILCLENHESVFVSAHTSAGKTVVAEYAIALSLKHGTKTVYTSPIKALSNQKYRDFRNTFEDVGLLTGDVQLNDKASCLIMTTEILRSMLYNGSDTIRDLEWVIFDEVHYISDAERGVVWEEVLIMLPSTVNVILLSATIPNTMEFANWVGRTKQKYIYVISTLKRPVPLEHYLYTGNSNKTSDQLFLIVDKNNKMDTIGYKKALNAKKDRETKSSQSFGSKDRRGGFSKNDKNVYLSLVEMLRKKAQLPVVVFTFSKKKCDENSSSLTTVDLTTSSEKSQIQIFLQKCISRLKGSDRRLPQVLHMKDLLKKGVAVHHSGVLPILKEVVEMLFQRGLVKLLFATETFAMGVNMPARTVVFDSIRKHDGTCMRNLVPGEYIQMAGRAGRRGLDTTGLVIILCKGDVPEISDLQSMMLGKPTHLESRFRLTYTMILNLLTVAVIRVQDVMKRSFAEFHTRKDSHQQEVELKVLTKQLESIKPVYCYLCQEDLEKYYDTCTALNKLRQETQLASIKHSKVKVLSIGRVVVVNTDKHKHTLGVILSLYTASRHSKFKTLVICDQSSGYESKLSTAFSKKLRVQMIKKTNLYQPEGVCGHEVVELVACDLYEITSNTLDVSADKILSDWNTRQIPRFRDKPPSQLTSVVVQELLRLIEDNPDGLPALNPVKELKIQDMEFVEKYMKMQSLQEVVFDYKCLMCQAVDEHFAEHDHNMELRDKVKELGYQLSEDSLLLLPEYHQRIKVLQKLHFIDQNMSLLLKGRVGCEISHHELILTQLIFENVLTELPAEEIVALLSCMVFQQKNCSSPTLTDSLEKGMEMIKSVARNVAALQQECGLNIDVEEFVRTFKFGLTEVVYEWAKGTPFADITALTDVSEGIIVRTIQRLDETCREVGNASRKIGSSTLLAKMRQASELIKRDIVFAASLYTHS
ncbi:superkiller complex protein 2-like [Antedon mediterranea]|uniref:superkiller complex protein 2-like n=1 Tax=Antedon mediterranea TaxID=105859 RepID=UPI003AF996DF